MIPATTLAHLDLPQDALFFAMAAHGHQTRKYTEEPYIAHPIAVALMLREHFRSEEGDADEDSWDHPMYKAAILHDVVEDTSVTLLQLTVVFGSEVAGMVDWLTNKTTKADGNRAKRKALECLRLGQAPKYVKCIKMCDLMDNTKTIVEHDPEFAKVYLKEKLDLIYVLQDGDDILHAKAFKQVSDAMRQLGL